MTPRRAVYVAGVIGVIVAIFVLAAVLGLAVRLFIEVAGV